MDGVMCCGEAEEYNEVMWCFLDKRRYGGSVVKCCGDTMGQSGVLWRWNDVL